MKSDIFCGQHKDFFAGGQWVKNEISWGLLFVRSKNNPGFWAKVRGVKNKTKLITVTTVTILSFWQMQSIMGISLGLI